MHIISLSGSIPGHRTFTPVDRHSSFWSDLYHLVKCKWMARRFWNICIEVLDKWTESAELSITSHYRQASHHGYSAYCNTMVAYFCRNNAVVEFKPDFNSLNTVENLNHWIESLNMILNCCHMQYRGNYAILLTQVKFYQIWAKGQTLFLNNHKTHFVAALAAHMCCL